MVLEPEEELIPSSSSSKTTTNSSKDIETTHLPPNAATEIANMNGNDSDGFETTSEQEVSDSEEPDQEQEEATSAKPESTICRCLHQVFFSESLEI